MQIIMSINGDFKRDYVTASEIREYVYCKRAWWLKLNHSSLPSIEELEGNIQHDTLFNWINRNRKVTLLAFGLFVIGVVLVATSLLLELLW